MIFYKKAGMSILLFILFAAIILILANSIHKYIVSRRYATVTLQHPPTPENTIITFDLHDVLVQYDYGQIVNHFWQEKQKLRLFLAFLHPVLLYDTIKLFLNDAVAEQYIISLPQKHKILQPYIPLGIKIANSQTIVPQMFELVKELKKLGYTLDIFSNIGAEIFKDLEKKYPVFFSYFNSVTLPSQANGYIRKPSHNSFKNYLANHHILDKQIIFIDDKMRNIKPAYKHKIVGILYKNPDQLKEQLLLLGILKRKK